MEPFHEKTNILDNACIIDLDQPKHAAQAYSNIHCLPPVDFLLQELLLYTYLRLIQNVSARISLRGLRRLIWSIHNEGSIMLVFIVERPN